MNLGFRRIKAQVLGVQSREVRGCEAAKWREDQDRPSGKDAWKEIERSHELGSSQVESPNIGYSKSRGREVAREGQLSDPDHRRTVGSAWGSHVARDRHLAEWKVKGTTRCEIVI